MSLMRSHNLIAGTAYQLKCLTDKAQVIEVRHVTGEIDCILLPSDAFQHFQYAPLEHDVEICAESLEVHKTQPLHWSREDTKHILRKSRFAAPLHYGGCIYSFDRPVKGNPKASLEDNRGMDLGSESLATLLSSQMILDAIPELPDHDVPVPQFDGSIAIVLHLHYPELWAEFSAFFKHSKLEFRLIVTLTSANPDLEARIASEFPGVVIQVVKNLGRDVRPFVKTLQSGLLDDVDLICKLHGKRSILSGASGSRFGHLWRRRNLLDLIGSPARVSRIMRTFKERPTVGMLGSAPLRLRNGGGSDPGFERSLPIRTDLCATSKLDPACISDDFFAGTMFWVRRSAVDRLVGLSAIDDLFTDEANLIGDQFEHGLERFFADCTRAAGYILADIEPLSLSKPGARLRSSSGRLLAPKALSLMPNINFSEHWAIPVGKDLAGQRLAMLAITSLEPEIPVHHQQMLLAMKNAGYKVVLCVACPTPSTRPPDHWHAFADAVFLRDIGGFEFPLWGAAFKSAPILWKAKEILFATGSIIGPVGDPNEVFSALKSSSGDCITGLATTESCTGFSRHLFLLRSKALAHPEVRAFFETALSWNKESESIYRYEHRFQSHLEQVCKLQVSVLEPDVAKLGRFIALQDVRNIVSHGSQHQRSALHRYLKDINRTWNELDTEFWRKTRILALDYGVQSQVAWANKKRAGLGHLPKILHGIFRRTSRNKE